MTKTSIPAEMLTVCHKSQPPARSLVAVRLAELPTPQWDWQFTLTCLQGLVNREQPVLFLAQDRYDEFWLRWLVERGDVDEVLWISAQEALQRYLGRANGLVITDPGRPASLNVATMLAAIHGRAAATPALADLLGLAARIGVDGAPVLDLRTMGWHSDAEAYRWFYGQHYEALTHRMCAMTDPYDIPLRDYLVEFCVPLFWINSTYDAEEAAIVEDLLMRLPPNIPCLGWPYAPCSPDVGLGEHMGVTLVNEYAKWELCTGYETVSRAVSNLSVHSGTQAQITPRESPPLPPLEPKVYLTFIRTDGDGPNFYRECYLGLWEDAHHGHFPMAWQQGPAMADLMPDILDYYYTHATPNDAFVNALTGIGYIHEDNYAYMYPPEQRAAIWQEYLHLSRIYRERLGLTCLTTYHEMTPDKLEALCRLGFRGVFANYHRSFITSHHNQVEEVAGVPVFRACNQANSVEASVRDIRQWTPRERPAFLYVSLTNWQTRMEYVQAIITNLGPEYVPVLPDQLVGLYWQAKGAQQAQ